MGTNEPPVRLTGRRRRRLFTTVSAASLALCAATCVLWAWSADRSDVVSWAAWGPDGQAPAARIWWAGAVAGRLFVSAERVDFASPALRPMLRKAAPDGPHREVTDLAPLRAMGVSPLRLWDMERPFAAARTARAGPGLRQEAYAVRAPAWAVAGVFGVLPGVWLARWWRARARRRPGGFPVGVAPVNPRPEDAG